MTNGEKLQETFPDIEIVSIVPNEIVVIKKLDNVSTYSNISFTYKWWNAEYKEPTTKNNLGIDAVSRQAVDRLVLEFIRKTTDESIAFYEHFLELPSVIPQEPRWIPVSEKKPNKGGEYLLWGKICDDDDEEYCFLGDYYEFEEKFGIEKSNYDPHTLGFIDTEIEEYYSVIAWMPLPTSYQGEKNE